MTQTMKIFDLIYLEDLTDYDEVTALARDAGYRVGDASDEIHRYRLSIEADIEQDEHYLWLLRNGLFTASLDFQMCKELHHEHAIELVRQVVMERNAAKLLAPDDDADTQPMPIIRESEQPS